MSKILKVIIGSGLLMTASTQALKADVSENELDQRAKTVANAIQKKLTTGSLVELEKYSSNAFGFLAHNKAGGGCEHGKSSGHEKGHCKADWSKN